MARRARVAARLVVAYAVNKTAARPQRRRVLLILRGRPAAARKQRTTAMRTRRVKIVGVAAASLAVGLRLMPM